jgi:hypothetical protein
VLLQVCNISATFMKTSAVLQFALGKCACSLQLYRVPSPIGKDKEVSISLQVSLALSSVWTAKKQNTNLP